MTGLRAWALVPARGGSQSIVGKNLVPLAGVPMLDYGVRAAIASARFERIVCSTDDAAIADRARHLGIAVQPRPAHLGGNEVAVAEVARDFLRRHDSDGLPDVLALIQPTSPFIEPAQIRDLLDRMAADPEAQSGQTVCLPAHNYHAWNQRVVEGGRVRFHFRAERESAYNKQRKPKFHVFGNLVAVRPAALLKGKDFFAEPSAAVVIPWPYNLDVDGPDDVTLAEALLAAGVVRLSQMQSR